MVINNIEDVKEKPLGKAEDLTKFKFNFLQPLYRIEHNGNKTWWLCKCDCGKFITADAANLKNKRTQSCGCQKTDKQLAGYELKTTDLVGQKFGKLTVLEKTDKRDPSGHIIWKCQCDCGKIKEVRGYSLKNGNTKSCGCYNIEQTIKRDKERVVDLTGQIFDELTVLEKTNQSNLKNGVIWKCKCSCGQICYKTTNGLKKNKINSCGCVTQSKGCYNISKILLSNNINFIREYKFNDCRNIYPLPFDFYLPDYNILIEFDGEQHFKIKPHFDNIEYIHNNDMVKNHYCFENNLTLIRIPFDYSFLTLKDLISLKSKFIITQNNIETYYTERSVLWN